MFAFIFVSICLGIGLAMDACAVSMANGFAEPKMEVKKIFLIAFMFGIFQGIMPLIGYFVGSAFIEYIEKFIPWIALFLLCFIGGKMIFEAVKDNSKKIQPDTIEEQKQEKKEKKLTFKALLVQSIATSIDALSVGLAIADYSVARAIACASIIMTMTFLISFVAVFIGKKFGTKLGGKSEIIGGVILIFIGLEIFITGII